MLKRPATEMLTAMLRAMREDNIRPMGTSLWLIYLSLLVFYAQTAWAVALTEGNRPGPVSVGQRRDM
jgi:hypothetical protein